MKITYVNDNKYAAPGAPDWIRRSVAAWLTGAAAEYLLLPSQLRDLAGLKGLARMSMARLVIIAAVVFALLSLCRKKIPAAAERWLILAAGGLLLILGVLSSFTVPFLMGCLLVALVLIVYCRYGWQGQGNSRGLRRTEGRWGKWVVASMAAVFFALVSVWTVARVRSFSTPTFDFGIFAQMFHSMKTTGLPITTLERDGVLSHFAVHVSPVYYLMLPFYCLVPRPETLQILQAAVLVSAVIPLWMLGKHHGIPQWARILLSGILLAYPAYAGGASYDLHENCFLTPLMLWLFYGFDRRSAPITAVAALLTLSVKEDAAVYVAVAGLYVLLRGLLRRNGKWDRVAGIFLMAGAVCWFVVVTGYLAAFGDGVMTYRYKNFMYNGSGSLVTVIKAVLLCPLKAVYECMDPEKLKFMALTLLPLAGLPLLTRRFERYVLLIPYLLVNLMSDYQYQHDIFFQYTYGATGCLIYLTLVNAADIRIGRTRLVALLSALMIGICCFFGQIMPKISLYTGKLSTYGAYYDGIRAVLETVPEEASVASTTYYTTWLSGREQLYDLRYGSLEHVLSCEYIVVGVTDGHGLKSFGPDAKSAYEKLKKILQEQGYESVAEYPGKIVIYRKA